MYYRPAAIIGTGGFASFPILFVGSLLRYKTYIQEQNCFAGLTNKLLSKRVDKVFVAHDGMQKFFPQKNIINYGNPVRHSLKTQSSLVVIAKSREFFSLSHNKFTILVVGGSLGAEPINKSIYRHLKLLMKDDIQLIWQTGETEYDKYNHLHSNHCSVNKFIDRMDLAYAASDLVISRAGAIVIAEISFLSKASILIPSPHVTDDHQTANAHYLKTNNACILLAEKNLNTEELINNIRKLQDNTIRKDIGKNANKLFHYDAADNIAKAILKT